MKMTKYTGTLLVILFLAIYASAQNSNSSTSAAKSVVANSNSNANATAKPKRPPVFRATKDQVVQAQTMLKQKGMYAGEATGKLDDATRAALKKYQEGEKIRATGTINRITLEKMGITLTEKQMLIPATLSSLQPEVVSEKKTTRAPVFRADKDQIMQAQKMLKDKAHYSGEQTGKLDDATRAGLRKYQEAEGIKVTGTLNRETLEKMGIPLNEKQKTQ